jgi:predicted RNA polymerase sigma factor
MFESALTNFDVAVKLQSDFTAHVWRGATLKQLSRYDKAIHDFDRAIALEANAAYLSLVSILFASFVLAFIFFFFWIVQFF